MDENINGDRFNSDQLKDLMYSIQQDAPDVYVREDESGDEDEDDEDGQIETMNPGRIDSNKDLEQFMQLDSSPPLIGQSHSGPGESGNSPQQFKSDLEKIKHMIRNAIFQKALQFIQNKLVGDSGSMPDEQLIFYNECLVYVFFKLKEYQNAKILAEQMLAKLDKQILFSVSENEDEALFPLRYLLATSLFEVKNIKDSLKILYKLLLETETKMKNPKTTNLDPLFAMINQNKEEDVIEAEDDFCDFTKNETQQRVTNDFGNMNQDSEELTKVLKKEKEELFGIFPSQENLDGKFIMISMEICRVHLRQQDFRNAYKVMLKCVTKYPMNPYLNSRMGRLCLEAGRKQEATEYFNIVAKMMKTSSNASPKKDGLSNLLNEENHDPNLAALNFLNKGFSNIFDGNYKDAIENFRKIQNYKPSNIVAANNIATCHIFCNDTLKGIELLQKLVQNDPKKNLNESTISNLMNFYEVQYHNPLQYKNILADYCNKNGKDNLNAGVYVQQKVQQSQIAQSIGTSVSQSLSLSQSMNFKK